ncbi:hypothetical protein EVAR_103283_1 [Eumeta japonica]|uniref:Pickpocket protein 28 n=1 Tax=Eumeta variegata TaxID=151549 RepID=A0A4C1XNJ7_EUMVA|nr:hypothetical protein EVAR_103283_1 [Eumeta japonica]
MKWFDLFSNIGSTCGFVTGFSFVSILEFVYFFTIKLARELKRQKESDAIETKPVKTVPAASVFPIMRYRPIYWNELNGGRRAIRFPEID